MKPPPRFYAAAPVHSVHSTARGCVFGLFTLLAGSGVFGASSHAGDGPLPALLSAARARQTGPDTFVIGQVTLNSTLRRISFPAKLNMDQFAIEYAVVTPRGKTHESLLVTEAAPRDVHLAALLLGVKPSLELGDTNRVAPVPPEAAVSIDVSWAIGGSTNRQPLGKLIALRDPASSKQPPTLKTTPWLYNGSRIEEGRFYAQDDGSLISLIRDPAALINNPAIDRDDDEIHFPNKALLPEVGAAVTVELFLR